MAQGPKPRSDDMARIKVRFVNFAHSDALAEYAKKHIESLSRRLERRLAKDPAIEVQFRLDARAPMGTVKNSEVMIHYRYPGLKKEIYVKKYNKDLRRALIEAIHAAETIIQKATEKYESGRRERKKVDYT